MEVKWIHPHREYERANARFGIIGASALIVLGAVVWMVAR
jgi:hypothetical protein